MIGNENIMIDIVMATEFFVSGIFLIVSLFLPLIHKYRPRYNTYVLNCSLGKESKGAVDVV